MCCGSTTPAATYIFDDPTLPPVEADQMVVRAVTDTTTAADDQTDDFEAFTLYEQTLTSLTCTNTPQEEPDPGIITVTVLDQNSNPIAGIDVYEDNGDPLGETDGRGQVTTLEGDDSSVLPRERRLAERLLARQRATSARPTVNNLAANVNIATSPSEGALPVGTAVTETITVTDNAGDPISNRAVRIIRNGPGSNAETVFQTTNSSGVTTYEFNCSTRGVTSIAVGITGPVGPGVDPFTFATANDTVVCGAPAAVERSTSGCAATTGATRTCSGSTARRRLLARPSGCRRRPTNGWKNVGQAKSLNSVGNKKFVVRDKNGNKVTRYRAKVSATSDTRADTSNVVRRR